MGDAQLLERARRLMAAGPHSPDGPELAAVHALLWPGRDAVCETCRAELGRAYYAIQRWVSQQDASSTLSPSSLVNKTENVTARFHSDGLIFTPHGMGVSYTNANLTDKAARDILAADPDAARHFAVLPPEATAEETVAEQAAAQATASPASVAEPLAAVPAGFDYAKLASALADEFDRRSREGVAAAPAPTPEPAPASATSPAQETTTSEVTLTAQPGGQGADGVTSASTSPAVVEVTTVTPAPEAVNPPNVVPDAGQEGEKPVRLSRMGKDQLVATYRTELKLEPAEGLTNDELREAIANHRASQANPE